MLSQMVLRPAITQTLYALPSSSLPEALLQRQRYFWPLLPLFTPWYFHLHWRLTHIHCIEMSGSHCIHISLHGSLLYLHCIWGRFWPQCLWLSAITWEKHRATMRHCSRIEGFSGTCFQALLPRISPGNGTAGSSTMNICRTGFTTMRVT